MCPIIAFFGDCGDCWIAEECAGYGAPERVGGEWP